MVGLGADAVSSQVLGDVGAGQIHSSVHNHINQERHLYNRQTFKLSRSAALAEWRGHAV